MKLIGNALIWCFLCRYSASTITTAVLSARVTQSQCPDHLFTSYERT
jgi:hypothetical protein